MVKQGTTEGRLVPGSGKEAGYRSPVLCQNSAQPASTKELRLCLLFIHPGAPNLINLRSVGCAFYLFIRQPMGRKSALRREIPWILRGFQGRLSC